MNNRFKKIRKELNMTQKNMGDILGVINTTISAIENGSAPLTDRNIDILCEKLNVNKEWLKNGTGEMFLPTLPVDEFTQLLVEIEDSDDEFIKNVLKTYWKLDDADKKAIKSFVYSLVNEQKK